MLALAFTACSETSIEGSWVEPVPGMEQMMQGFKLEKKQQRSNYFCFPVVLQMAHVLRQRRLNK